MDFQLLGREYKSPVGYKEITFHLIFDMEMDLTGKAWHMEGGHLTSNIFYVTYASVVSQYSARIAFLGASFGDLDILVGDIHNSYLNA